MYLESHARASLSCISQTLFISCLNPVKHELNFHDKDTQFYRFKDSEFGLNHMTNEKDGEDDLQECLSLLSQLGPDALLSMILRKWSACSAFNCYTSKPACNKPASCFKGCTERCSVLNVLFPSAQVTGALRTSRSYTRNCSMSRLLLIFPLQSVTLLPSCF